MKGLMKTDKKTEISYEYIKKSKKIIVILHGPGVNSTSLKLYLSYLHKKRYSTMVFDLRGHGRSTTDKISVKGIINDLNFLVKILHINPFVLIGMCASSNIVVEYIKKFPNKVQAGVCIDLPNKKFFNLKSWGYVVLGYFLLLLKKFFVKRKKVFVDFSKIFSLSLIKGAIIVRKGMSYSQYLILLKECINIPISFFKCQNSTILENGGLLCKPQIIKWNSEHAQKPLNN